MAQLYRGPDGQPRCPYCDDREPRPYIGVCPRCNVFRADVSKPCPNCHDRGIEGTTPETIEPATRMPHEALEAEPLAAAPGGAGTRTGKAREPTLPQEAALDAVARQAALESAESSRLFRQITYSTTLGGLPPSDAEAPGIDITGLTQFEKMGAGLYNYQTYLQTLSLPPDIERIQKRCDQEIDTDAEHKLRQITKTIADLQRRALQVQWTREVYKLAMHSHYASVAVNRQREAKRAEFEHWLQADRYAVAAARFRPHDLLYLEDEADFLSEVHRRLSVIYLDAAMQEWNIKYARRQRYVNVDQEFVFLSETDFDKHLTTFRGKTNVAHWSTYNQIAMVSCLKVGNWLGVPLLVFLETPETVRRRLTHTDISSSLDSQSALSKLALSEIETRKAQEDLAEFKEMNNELRERDKRREVLLPVMALNLLKYYLGMLKGEAVREPGLKGWLKAYWPWLLLIAAGVICAIVLLYAFQPSPTPGGPVLPKNSTIVNNTLVVYG